MRRGFLVTLLLGCALLPDPVIAQDAPVFPGSIVTVTVSHPNDRWPETQGSGSYRVVPAEGVRLLGDATGRFTKATAQRLPSAVVTLGIPAKLKAGPFEAATVVFVHENRVEIQVPLMVNVAARHRARLEASLAHDVDPGKVASISWTLENLGNAVDTVRFSIESPQARWSLEGSPTAVIAPGETQSGVLQVQVPPELSPGESHTLYLIAQGSGEPYRREVTVWGALSRSSRDTQYHLPARILVGSHGSPGNPLGDSRYVSLQAAGRIAPETDLSLYLHQRNSYGSPFAVRDDLAAGNFHVGIRHRGFNSAIGDVSSSSPTLGASPFYGRGASVRLRGESTGGEVMIARPQREFSEPDAYMVVSNGFVRHTKGEFGASAFHADLPARGLYGGEATGVFLTAKPALPTNHMLEAEGGLMSLVDATGREVHGPAYYAQYSYWGGDAYFSTRLRSSPRALRWSGPSFADEWSANFRVPITTGLSVVARADRLSYPHSSPDSVNVAHSGFAGISYRLNQTSVELNGMNRRTVGEIPGMNGEERTLHGAFRFPLGPGQFSGHAEFGDLVISDTLRTLQSLYGQYFLYQGQSSLWMSTGYSNRNAGQGELHGTMSASSRVGAIDLSAELGARFRQDGQYDISTVRLGAVLPVSRAMEVIAGVERDVLSVSQGGWRVSLALRSSLQVPTGFHKPNRYSGTVFDDRNGNGTRDSGEPAMAGVHLTYGRFRAISDRHGRFTFNEGAAQQGSEESLRATNLPAGYVMAREGFAKLENTMAIALVKMGTLQAVAFLDSNADGIRDHSEGVAPYATGRLLDSAGGIREIYATESASFEVPNLVPGEYILIMDPSEHSEAARNRTQVKLVLRPGEILEVAAPVPHIQVRFNEVP